jgi:hypothetical protein
MKKLIVLVALVLAGCGKPHDPKYHENGVTVYDSGGSGSVQEITLTDGTRCAILVGYSKGGIDCDWNGSK